MELSLQGPSHQAQGFSVSGPREKTCEVTPTALSKHLLHIAEFVEPRCPAPAGFRRYPSYVPITQ
jgi:hypothetical protein